MSHQDSPPNPAQSTSRWANLLTLVTTSRVRWAVVAFWIVVIALTAPVASRIGEVESNGNRSQLPASSESLEADLRLDEFEEGDTIAALIVFHRDAGLTDEDRSAVSTAQEQIQEANPAYVVTDPVPSEDGKATLLTVILPNGSDEERTDGVNELRSILQASVPDGLDAKVTGPAGIGVDLGKVFEGINGRLLIAAAIVVAVLLLITYRSPFLWAIPLLVVGFADRLATAIVFLLAKTFDFTTSGQSVGIMAILVFGAGTDYALLLIARYREELRRHETASGAMGVALRQAAPAIVASGGTVMLGLACLFAADLNSNRLLGPTGIAGILCALMLTLTLLPAILVIVGRGVFWPFVPKFGSEQNENASIWARLGAWISHNPRRVWIGTTIALLVLSAGALNYTVSFTQADQFTNEPEAIQGANLIAESFPAGSSSPTIVVANRDATEQVTSIVSGVEGVANVRPSSESDTYASLSVTLTTEPGTDAAFAVIEDIRSALATVPETDAVVGGADAEGLDKQQAGLRDQQIVIPLVLGVVFVVLAVLLRSLLAPLLLLATSVLSTIAALGVTVLIFQGLLGYEGLQAGVLLLGFVFLIALGVDYNIFLMSRVHEEAPLIGTRPGMLRGLTVTGGVITSAGIVLAATFAVLGILPLVALAQIGFLVAFGVLLDALLVRSVLVPAITLDLGKRIWWPSALGKQDGTPTA